MAHSDRQHLGQHIAPTLPAVSQQQWVDRRNTAAEPSTHPRHAYSATPGWPPYDQDHQGVVPRRRSPGDSTPSYQHHGLTIPGSSASSMDDSLPNSPITRIAVSVPPLGLVTRTSSSGSSSLKTGHPPAGVTKCASCGTSVSPEWRKGPSGKKELCNACGLRFARSKAKKEGYQPQKRRKEDKSLTPFSTSDTSTTSPTAMTAPYQTYNDSIRSPVGYETFASHGYRSDASMQAPPTNRLHGDDSGGRGNSDSPGDSYGGSPSPMGSGEGYNQPPRGRHSSSTSSYGYFPPPANPIQYSGSHYADQTLPRINTNTDNESPRPYNVVSPRSEGSYTSRVITYNNATPASYERAVSTPSNTLGLHMLDKDGHTILAPLTGRPRME